MQLTDRELRLIMLSLDNAAHGIRESAESIVDQTRLSEATDMDSLWDRVREELEFRKSVPHA